MSEHLVRLGQTITKLRESAGLSQKELCAALGVSQSLLSRLENGAQEPGISKLIVVAEFFGLTVGRLLDGQTDGSTQLPGVHVARSVTCDRCGLIGSGLDPDKAREVQARHRRDHLAEVLDA